ncbi:MAG: hypothetical protein ACKVZ0_22955 [Gemmatimonadales bacterium]
MENKERARRRRRRLGLAAPGPMTPATAPTNPSTPGMGRPGSNQQQRLDEALDETFPASDPIATRIE